MTDRERFIACLLGHEADRTPYWLLWEPWESTWTRWRREGMPEHLTDAAAAWAVKDKPLSTRTACTAHSARARIETLALATFDELSGRRAGQASGASPRRRT